MFELPPPSSQFQKRFEDLTINREGRYTLGRDLQTDEKYLSIPVANRMVDYDEYYRISEDEFDHLETDQAAGLAFADACRSRRKDDRLILKPGADRGIAI